MLAIYSRSIKRIKLKYFFRYYENVILKDYLNYQKLCNMFKKNTIKYQNSYSHLKNKTSNNQSLFRSNQNSYSNLSEPMILTPQINRNMAYLMTPCYLIDDDNLNNSFINEYNKKYNKNNIEYNSSSPEKHKILYRTNSSDFLKHFKPFNNTSKNISNPKKKDYLYKKYDKYYDKSKLYYPLEKYDNYYYNDIKNESKKGKYNNIKRPFFPGNNNINLTRTKLIDRELFPKYLNTNKSNNYFDKYNNNNTNNEILTRNSNDFTLGSDLNKGKTLKKNKSYNEIQNQNKKKNPFFYKKNNQDQNINKEILNHLYENNFLNNNKSKKAKSFGKKNTYNNVLDDDNQTNKHLKLLNAELRPNIEYSIFGNPNNHNNKNKSNKDLFPNNKFENSFNKPFNKDIISKFNYSLNSAKNKIPYNKESKKGNSSVSLNNNSNHSNSQSNNAGVNPVSTNYSIPGGHSHYSSQRDNPKKLNNSINNILSKNLNNSKPTPLVISPGIVDEFFRDSIGKKSSSSSNRISLQSMNDSKMMEIAGHYGFIDDSSSDNYKMNNVIHSKKNFYKNYKQSFNNNNRKKIPKKIKKFKKNNFNKNIIFFLYFKF